jgi:hypothetical protein
LQGKVVELRIQVKRFRCQNKGCPRKTFVEQVPGVTVKRARQTERFAETIRVVGYALGGEAGCRLAKRIGMTVSADTVLRRVTQSAIHIAGNRGGSVSMIGLGAKVSAMAPSSSTWRLVVRLICYPIDPVIRSPNG